MKSLAIVIAVLSYNVHGLNHWVVSDDPEKRMPLISAKLDPYDVALIQESWTYTDALAAQASHSTKELGNGPHPGTFGLTGLATFAKPVLVAVSRGSLGACSGWLGGANDCLADKGYLRLRLRLEDGVEVDFWNLHLDAGDGEGDRAAREQQLENLAMRVESLSSDSPLVIAGDFNSSAENPADVALLERFEKRLGLRDSGARSDPAGAFAEKHIDYILLRDGRGVRLETLAAGEAAEFASEGAPLSDHPALFARVRVTRASDP